MLVDILETVVMLEIMFKVLDTKIVLMVQVVLVLVVLELVVVELVQKVKDLVEQEMELLDLVDQTDLTPRVVVLVVVLYQTILMVEMLH